MLIAVTHGLGAAAFLSLVALMLLNRKPQGLGLFALFVFVLTALWAGSQTFQAPSLFGASHALGSLHIWMWLQFLAAILVRARSDDENGRAASFQYVIAVLGLVAFANDLRFLSDTTRLENFAFSQEFARITLAVTGILLVENLYRNTRPNRRWHVVPLCLAAGFLFSYDLFLFVDGVVAGSVDPSLFAGRGFVLVLIAPLLILTMARNDDLRVDIHVSRRVVFHTGTLIAGGLFLFAAGGIASFFGGIAGEWGGILQISFFLGALLVLLTTISSEGLRLRAWRLIAENFFSHRYDYRMEWLRLVETLSASDSPDPLQERVVRALADVAESPGGVLFLKDTSGVYRPSAALNMPLDQSVSEPSESSFIAKLKDGQVLEISSASFLPEWAKSDPPFWLAVPLLHQEDIIGFIALRRPAQPVKLNWESFDLLRTIGRQIAGYLAQEQATRLLAEGQTIAAYNKRFAFVIHDVKNLVSKLTMLVANLKRFGDNPEFRKDVISTLENSAERLNGLLRRLRQDSSSTEPLELLDPIAVIEDVVKSHKFGAVHIETEFVDIALGEKIRGGELRAVCTHLLTNAAEASPVDGRVKIAVRSVEKFIEIDVTDQGPGMEPRFVRDELFKPMRSTKSEGHGLGAYQARELVRGMGGELEVISIVGEGTTMRIRLPKIMPEVIPFYEEAASA